MLPTVQFMKDVCIIVCIRLACHSSVFLSGGIEHKLVTIFAFCLNYDLVAEAIIQVLVCPAVQNLNSHAVMPIDIVRRRRLTS